VFLAELQANTYLSYYLAPGDVGSASIGTYQLSSPNKIDVYITMGNDGVAGSAENGTYTVSPTALSLDLTLQAEERDLHIGPYSRTTSNAIFEGVWSGFTINQNGQYCLTMAEFHNNLWRGYQTRCDQSYSFGFGTFLGSFLQTSASTVNLTYAFVDFHNNPSAPDLQGVTLPFSFTVAGNTLTLVGQGGAVTIQLAKVITLPTVQQLTITLTGNASAFIAEVRQAFIDELATELGIDPRNILIDSVRSGSIIVDVTILDDAKSGVSSTVAQGVIENSGQIGGFPVQGVANMTPGGNSDATRSVVSWLLVVALIVLAFLA